MNRAAHRCVLVLAMLASGALAQSPASSSPGQAAPSLQDLGRDCRSSRSSNDGTTNFVFDGLLEELAKSDASAALQSAKALLYRHTQTISSDQRSCADRVIGAIEARNKAAANQPSEQLKTLYRNYIEMQACHESRKEFKVKYVTAQEMDAAKAVTKRQEQALLAQFPALARQKDALWEQAKREYGGSNLGVSLGLSGTKHNPFAEQQCKLGAMRFTGDQQNQQQKIKKDF